jgi:hypothetical protein
VYARRVRADAAVGEGISAFPRTLAMRAELS